MIIRRERPCDIEAVHRLHDSVFSRAAGQPVAHTVESEILRRLRADEGAWLPKLSLVLAGGEDGPGPDGIDGPAGPDGLAGHVVASRGLLDGSVPVLGAGPLAIRTEVQRTGLGTLLVNAAIAAAEALDEPLIVILGDPGYYRRHGFVLAATMGVTPPVPEWAPHFQARPLATYDPALHRGAFTYAPAFDATV